MSKRVVRKTIQGKQSFKENGTQTKVPPNQTVTRSGPNLIEQGANLIGLTNLNPLVKLGANLVADLCDDNPFQNPVQRMEKKDTNPVRDSIETQVNSVQKQVEDIVKENVKIREISYPEPVNIEPIVLEPVPYPEISPVIEPKIESTNPSHTEIKEKSRWIPCISKDVSFEAPQKEKTKTKTRTIQGKTNPAALAYNKRQQNGRELTMKIRKLKPIFPIPVYDDDCENPYKDL